MAKSVPVSVVDDLLGKARNQSSAGRDAIGDALDRMDPVDADKFRAALAAHSLKADGSKSWHYVDHRLAKAFQGVGCNVSASAIQRWRGEPGNV